MKPKGGRRRGAGRPKGSGDKNLQLVRDALKMNRERLITKAISLALGRRPNVKVLCKLLDKILPTQLTQEITLPGEPFPKLTEEALHEQTIAYAALYVQRHGTDVRLPEDPTDQPQQTKQLGWPDRA